MSSHPNTTPHWIEIHFPALLYGWFWIGMALCGLLAPPERVAMLESGLVTEGWHLSVMCLVFGGSILGLYLRRTRHAR